MAGGGWGYTDENHDGVNDTVHYGFSLRNKAGTGDSTAWWNLTLDGPNGTVNQTAAGPTPVSGNRQSVEWKAALGLDPGDPAGNYTGHVWVSEAGADRCEHQTYAHVLGPP